MAGRLFSCAAVIAIVQAAGAAARGDALDEIGKRGELRWGGDQSGGAPYVFQDPSGKLAGFEVELAEVLAGKLGLASRFVQGQWDKLPQLLDRGDIDIVLNGYEWSPERQKEHAASIPYYIYKLQLLARRDDASIASWADLERTDGGARKRVGVLSASAAERYLEKEYKDSVEIVSYDGSTNAMTSVEQRQLDATLQDLPIAIHYARDFPGLHPVGDPIAPGYYVVFLGRDEEALRGKLDAAILEALEDGTLERIYRKYGIWSDDQREIARAARDWPPRAESPQGNETAGTGFLSRLPELGLRLLPPAGITIVLSCLSMPLAICIGLIVAIGRLYGPRWIGRPLSAYVEFLRGTPLLLQLYVIFYVLPIIGIRIPAFWSAVFGLAINYSAYEAENYRAGFLAVPRGQMEAALSLGMSKWTALRRVIIPQAMRIVVPPVTNDFIALFKDTSVCSVITVVELTGMYNRMSNNEPRLVLELGLMTAVLYLLMSYPLSILARRLEAKRSLS